MNTETLESVLSCPALPSLPAVAVQVIELTSDENVRIEDLAAAIQNDQALSAKILRTVNSSFYGLRQKCTSIQKALVLLGLGPVKSLALGFSLVSTLHDENERGFDWADYWSRGLNTGIVARLCAAHAPDVDPDECFLAGLIQDIGMVAMNRALQHDYVAILDATEGDHRKLVKHELSRLELQHPEVGAMLAHRWRLPSELVIPVRYHERPSAAPNQHAGMVRLVGLGNMVHDALVAEDPSVPLRKFYSRARDWFKIESDTCQQIVRDATKASQEMANVLSIETGISVDADEVIRIAEERLAEMATGNPEDCIISRNTSEIMKRHSDLDICTGVLGREALSEISQTAFDLLKAENEPFSVVHVLVVVNDPADQLPSDDVRIGIIALMRKYFEPCGGVLCRIRPDLFTAALPGCARADALSLAHEFAQDFERYAARRRVEHDRFNLQGSIGVATADNENAELFENAEQVILAGLQAVRGAARSVPFSVRTFKPVARDQRDAA